MFRVFRLVAKLEGTRGLGLEECRESVKKVERERYNSVTQLLSVLLKAEVLQKKNRLIGNIFLLSRVAMILANCSHASEPG